MSKRKAEAGDHLFQGVTTETDPSTGGTDLLAIIRNNTHDG